MKALVVLFSFLVFTPINTTVYLASIKGFDTDTIWKEDIYEIDDWKNFDKNVEVNQPINISAYNLHVMNACLFYASNKLRLSKTVQALGYSTALRNAAMVHSNEMVKQKFYSHIHPRSLDFKAPDTRMKLFGIANVLLAENIHNFGFEPGKITYLQLAEAIMEDFYKSPGHRQNLMNKNFTHTGCAALWEYDNKQQYYFLKVTQCFARL